MKLTFALLAASLAASVSAEGYELCCCTKVDVDHKRKCHLGATRAAADSKPGGIFDFSNHDWDKETPVKHHHPPYPGKYVYATGNFNDDNIVRSEEFGKLCKKQDAKQACWSPGHAYGVDYKGDPFPIGQGGP